MKPRVLVIEDNLANRELVRYLLEAHGLACEEAVDGETGLAMARSGRPDLVICDLQLPGIDGFEVLRGIRTDAALTGLPVVAVTAYAMVGDRERVLAAGFDGYIAKPLDPQRFVGEIAAFLAGSRERKADKKARGPGNGSRILVVDDRAANRELLATLLGYFGHTVVQAEDGAAALASVRARAPDLVITDLLMPNMDGEELCRQLRADPATAALPIIIHTASYRARQGRQVASRVGVHWVLPKPSESADIIAMVSQALGVETVWPAASLAGLQVPAGPLAGEANEGIKSLQVRNQRLTTLLESAVQIAAAQGEMLASGGLARDAQSLALRLTSLVNLGLELSFAREAEALAGTLARAAQDIMSARYIGVSLVGPDGELVSFVSRGLDKATHDAVGAAVAGCPAALRLMGPRAAGRMLVAARPGDFNGLPQAHPPVQTLIACPLAARDATFGWIYAADRLGDEGFTADDERLLLALASQLASAWQGLRVVEELDRRVVERTRELEAANHQLQAFSLLVSHDLRSPLGHIGGFAGALAQKFGAALPPEASRYIGKIEHNVHVMETLIEDLLNFARTSKLGIDLRSTEISELVQDCLAKFHEDIERRGVDVRVGPLPACRLDRPLMAQVLFNLVGNALKYSRKRKDAVVEIGARVEATETVVFVRDNGVGFDMEFAGKLFNPFERLHSISEFEGSGIGLALVKQVINRHGGRVWAESTPGQGACFYFTLPV